MIEFIIIFIIVIVIMLVIFFGEGVEPNRCRICNRVLRGRSTKPNRLCHIHDTIIMVQLFSAGILPYKDFKMINLRYGNAKSMKFNYDTYINAIKMKQEPFKYYLIKNNKLYTSTINKNDLIEHTKQYR